MTLDVNTATGPISGSKLSSAHSTTAGTSTVTATGSLSGTGTRGLYLVAIRAPAASNGNFFAFFQ
jgi:hypothetical protein